MTKDSYRRVDRNIYVEKRNGTHRFQVGVFPLKRVSRTFDVFAEGIAWALAERQRQWDRKAGDAPTVAESASATSGPGRDRPPAASRSQGIAVATAPSTAPQFPVASPAGVVSTEPGEFSVDQILAAYEADQAAKLACQSEASSRLRNLRRWFGHLRLKDLSRHVILAWTGRRLAGELGAGRGTGRERPGTGATVATKDMRRRARIAGRTIAPLSNTHPAPVSTQTVRHELGYLRRAVRSFFQREELADKHEVWLGAQPIMLVALPEQAAPRDRRVSDAELRRILARMRSPVARFAVMFAIATGLRRAEVVRLCWEDLDARRRVIRLRRPPSAAGSVAKPGRNQAHRTKPETKTHERSVPLTPLAMEVLVRYGVRERGRIFPLAAESFTQAWRRAADREGIVDARLHDCRREAVSRLVDEFDLPVEKVALFTGHKDLAVLQRHYLRPSPERLAEKLARIETTRQSGFGLLDAPPGPTPG